MKILATKAFWADALERAIKTLIQAVTASIVVNAGVVTLPTHAVVIGALVAAGLSIVTSVASALGQPNSISGASLVPPGL